MSKALERSQIVENVARIVSTKLFHPFWTTDKVHEKAEELRHLAAEFNGLSDEQFEQRVNSWLSEFGLSHTAFFHGSGRRVPAQFSLGAELRAFRNGASYAWFVQHVIEGSVAQKSGIRLGDTLLSVNGRLINPPEEPRFDLGQPHELLIESKNEQRSIRVELPPPTQTDRPPMATGTPLSHQVLDGKVGLIRVTTFPGAIGFDFARTLDGIVLKLKAISCDRIIIDLRGNPGGGLGSLRIMSYLVPDRRPAGYSLTRKGRARGMQVNSVPPIRGIPASKLGLWGMALRFGLLHRDRSLGLWTEGLGVQPFHGRIILLIDEFTRSAAEMIAAFARNAGATMLVGSRTPGQVLGAANFKVGGEYRVRVPLTAWYMPSGELIEGKGVTPDRVVEPSQQSLKNAQDAALDTAVELIRSM